MFRPLLFLAILCSSLSWDLAVVAAKPNVLFIAVDDLNDWVGCMGGHPQAKTPHIDALSQRGLLFTNAHCNAPLCNPSRASLMTGLLPSTNGVHGNQQDWRESPCLKGKATLPEYFKQHGYWTGGCGKLFHANHGGECGALNGGHGGLRGFNQPEAWTERFPNKDRQIAMPAVMPGQNMNGLDIWHWDWGPIDVPDAATSDGQATDWAVAQLQKKHDKPFFLAVGIYRPHGPWYVPPKYFESHPLDEIELPQLKDDDLDDVPPIAKRYLNNPNHLHRQILDNNLYPSAVQAYLANITFADAMVGKVLDALAASPYADNTIVCLWSDHGWHLGEKQKWHKSTHWEEATRVPLIIVAPDNTKAGSTCRRAVSLVDLFPTLIELCSLPPRDDLDGLSLVPLLEIPDAARDRPAITTSDGVHHSVRSDRWRYTRYSDGSEELYDHDNDPDEYTNLADDARLATTIQELAEFLPKNVNRVKEPSDAHSEPGFRPLFNGYDLTGWDGDPKLWSVQDGVLAGTSTADDPLPHNTFLIWKGGRTTNFELRLQIRVMGENNSGIQYRSRRREDLGPWVVSGYQADVHPSPQHNGMVYEEKGRGVLAEHGQKVVVTSEGKKTLAGRVESFDKTTLDQWNDLTIVARGNRLIHKLNGATVAELIDHDADQRALSGLLAFQLHRGAPMQVQLRNIRYKEFSPGGLLAPSETPLPDDATEIAQAGPRPNQTRPTSAPADAAKKDRPPNIVMLISDDQTWTDYGFMGHEVIQTPSLDKLAKESATFTRGYVPTALCRPSLVTMITGLYAHQHKITGNDPALPLGRNARNDPEYREKLEALIGNIDRVPTLPRMLAERGYISHQSGKWWEGNHRRGGFTHGMTHGDPARGGRHGDEGLKIGRNGMQPVFDFIDSAADKPFFLWYAPFLPHTPHNPPERILKKYQADGRPPELAKYYAMCEWFDETCGQLLEYLDKKNLSDNTIVVYVTDNGWIQRTADTDVPDGWNQSFAPKSKQSPYDGGTRTPIMIRWPGKIEPAMRDELVSSIDLAPTLLAATGLKPTAEMQGVNLLDVLGGQPLKRDAIFGESFAHDIADIDDPSASLLYRWCIERRWKLLLTYDGQIGRYQAVHKNRIPEPQLFDLQADPLETKNLAAEHPELVAKLKAKIDAWWPAKTPVFAEISN